MKALSVKQPWAWAMFEKGKDIENRTWRTKLRGEVLIHAGKQIDKKAPKWLLDAYEKDLSDQAMRGGIIGSVEITDCVDRSESKWFQGKYGFVLKNPKFMRFIPRKGQLGFFEVKL